MVFALLCGCHAVFPFDPPAPTTDLGVAVDGAKGDLLKADLLKADAPKADAPKTDADVTDLIAPADVKLPPDGPSWDAAQIDGSPLDALPLDQKGTTSAPCGPKGNPLPKPVVGWNSSKMRICEKISNTLLTQCKAAALCNTTGGWSLWGPSDYLKHGGKTTGTTIKAWLKACIRSGGASYTPTSAICASCNITAATAMATHWTCTGSLRPYDPYKYMGLRTDSSCYRVGVNAANTGGYWRPATSSTATMEGAVCCRP